MLTFKYYEMISNVIVDNSNCLSSEFIDFNILINNSAYIKSWTVTKRVQCESDCTKSQEVLTVYVPSPV